jgi:hypothetical protein
LQCCSSRQCWVYFVHLLIVYLGYLSVLLMSIDKLIIWHYVHCILCTENTQCVHKNRSYRLLRDCINAANFVVCISTPMRLKARGLAQHGGRLAGPIRRPAWLSGGEWPSRVWFCTWWTVHAAFPDRPHHLPWSGVDLQCITECTQNTVMSYVTQGRHVWHSSRPMPSLWVWRIYIEKLRDKCDRESPKILSVRQKFVTADWSWTDERGCCGDSRAGHRIFISLLITILHYSLLLLLSNSQVLGSTSNDVTSSYLTSNNVTINYLVLYHF